jgi:PAS domain-containing protein
MALLGGAMRRARVRAEQLASIATERNEQLRRTEAQYREIVEHAHEGIWHLDANGKTRFANRRMAEMLGCTPDKDGRELWTLISASPTHDPGGRFDGVLGMLSDVTKWNHADRRLRESEERLRVALDALRDTDQRKDEFLALLGHELRNPLAPISNALQVLKLRGADAAITERARHDGTAARASRQTRGRSARCLAHHARQNRFAM